jgi:hypothetical protein
VNAYHFFVPEVRISELFRVSGMGKDRGVSSTYNPYDVL